MSNFEKRYIGDGVYASFDGYQIWLTTDNNTEQRIALEPGVFRELIRYETDLRKHYARKPAVIINEGYSAEDETGPDSV